MGGVSVGVLDHFNIRTRNLAETVRFYEDVLGLEKGARPNFAFPGAWMYSEGKPVVHLVDISATAEPQKPDSGVVHHVAFVSRGFDGMKQRLTSKGMKFDSRQVPGGDAGAFRLTLVSVAIAMLALVASEVMARFANRRLDIE